MKHIKLVVGALVLLAALFIPQVRELVLGTADPALPAPSPSSTPLPDSPSDSSRESLSEGVRAIQDAFRSERSDVIVRAQGVVERALPDDNDGSRHQRFIVRLAPSLTVLIAHNIDLAPPVPLERGDRVEFRGEYEWNDRGGVVHWTHADPRGKHEEGWIRHEGKTYK